MKAIFLQLFVSFCFLGLFNCSNSEEMSTEPSREITAKTMNDEFANFSKASKFMVNKVLEIPDKAERRIAYRLLSKEEKMFLWKNKFDVLLNEGKLYGEDISLDKRQKALVKEVMNTFTIDFFDENINDKKELIKNVFIPDFIERATKVFPNVLMGTIFYETSTLEDLTNVKDTAENDKTKNNSNTYAKFDDPPANTCDCGMDHFFSCSWGQYDAFCKKSSCTYDTSGCGFLWGFECDGICNHF